MDVVAVMYPKVVAALELGLAVDLELALEDVAYVRAANPPDLDIVADQPRGLCLTEAGFMRST